MISYKDAYICTEQILPSHLKTFFDEEVTVIIIQKNESPQKIKSKIFTKNNSNSKIEDSFEELELTGNPLNLDISENLELSPLDKSVDSLKNDLRYHEFSLEQARKIVNQESNNWKKPIYCATDKLDNLKTCFLGCLKLPNQWTRWMIQHMGILPLENLNYSTVYNENLKYIFGKKKPDRCIYYMKNVYNLYGDNIENSLQVKPEGNNLGNIVLETVSENYTEKTDYDNLILKTHIQVIMGHKKSHINYLWKDLNVVLNYFNILINNDQDLNKETILNSSSESNFKNNANDIFANMFRMFQNYKEAENANQKAKIDLRNLRTETIFDKLWLLLSSSENLATVKNALLEFFVLGKDHFIKENGSLVSQCLQNIATGESPLLKDLDCMQSLYLLIDLGLEKLKNDYFTIIKYYAPFLLNQLEEIWRKYQTRNSDLNELHFDVPKNKLIEKTCIEKRLDILYQCHTLSEILVFLKNVTFTEFAYYITEKSFNNMCDSIFNKYFKESPLIWHELRKQEIQVNLLSFSCSVETNDSCLYKGKVPTTKMAKLVSTLKNYEVTTVVHCSQTPIFLNYEGG